MGFTESGRGLSIPLTVGEVALEPPTCTLDRNATLAEAARRLADDDSGFVPICHRGHLVGALYEQDLLRALADEKVPRHIHTLVSEQLPCCLPKCALVDAVWLMLSCYLRKLPVVDEEGLLLGMVTLSEAVAAAFREPPIADLLERCATSPSRFARRML